MIFYSSNIDMSTALVSRFDDMSIIHEPESDQLHLLNTSVALILNLLEHKKIIKSEMLQLIGEYCLDSLDVVEPADEADAYLQHLVDQGIIKKTQ